jgi:hypothetical protein
MLKVETLPEETQLEFNRITSTSPRELSSDDAAFLRSRKQYLRPEQVAIFTEVLNASAKKVVTEKKATKVEETKTDEDPFTK